MKKSIPESERSKPPRRARRSTNEDNHLLGGSSAALVYVIDMETARRLGDLDACMCWAGAENEKG